MAESGNLIFM